jgi:endonuclease/exonuclease/phosphatase family metal-dependent hydrolase
MRDFGANVLGLQEALRFQLDEIAKTLPQYDEIGVGRDDGVRAGEYAAILYDRRRLTPLDQGWFWLSDTPEVPGSMTWGNHHPRIVTWARFTDRVREKSFYVFNTHWDHESQLARERGASLLMQRIKARAATGDPVLLLGDFNVGLNNPAFQTLLEPLGEAPEAEAFADTFRTRYPAATDRIGTFHEFRGHRDGDKIDAVLASRAWQVLDADIVHVSQGGRYPSDHFPVTATLVLPPDPPPSTVMPAAQEIPRAGP